MRFSLKTINPQGIVIYRGPSLLNGQPITVIATNLKEISENRKTGSMVQTYILPEQIPSKAVFNGNDESVCGDCIHRYIDGAGSCYVNPIHGVNAVWKSLQKGNYAEMSVHEASMHVQERIVRLGAFGDPAAIPFEVWEEFLQCTTKWTGYTHQWKRPDAQKLRKYCMASCDTKEQVLQARKKGWRTFRIRLDDGDTLLPGEFQCPASQEENKRLTCETCRACDGGNPEKHSPAIIMHGPFWKISRLRKVLELKKQHKKHRGIYATKE